MAFSKDLEHLLKRNNKETSQYVGHLQLSAHF